MIATWAVLTSFALPAPPSPTEPVECSSVLATGCEPGVDAASELLVPPAPREHSKKESWLQDKNCRHDVHVADRDLQRGPVRVRPMPAATAAMKAGATVQPITTLYNIWTHEALPLVFPHSTAVAGVEQVLLGRAVVAARQDVGEVEEEREHDVEGEERHRQAPAVVCGTGRTSVPQGRVTSRLPWREAET